MSENKIIQLGNVMPTATRENPNQGRIYDIRGMAPTITDVSGGGGRQPMIVTRNRIRKLTPLECWRLNRESMALTMKSHYHLGTR